MIAELTLPSVDHSRSVTEELVAASLTKFQGIAEPLLVRLDKPVSIGLEDTSASHHLPVDPGFPATVPRDTTAVAGENAFPTSPSEGELPVARQQPALAVTECKHCIL